MIIKTVVLRCGIERAFELFTQHAGDWWPPERRHTDDPASEIAIEPGGRFFERGSDGVEVPLGTVRRFEAPTRVTLDWFPGTGPDAPTRVDIVFEPVAGGTLVTVRHAAGNAGTERFEQNAPGYERSWDLVLAAVARGT